MFFINSVFHSINLFPPTRAQLKCFYYPVLETGGEKKNSGYHQLPSHFQYSITIMNMVHNIQYHQRKKKNIEEMYPSECGRALKYNTCKGKNGCSIIPKRDAEKRQLLQRPNPNILPTILAPIILCRRDYMYNREGRLKSQGIFFQTKPNPNPQITQEKQQTQPRFSLNKLEVFRDKLCLSSEKKQCFSIENHCLLVIGDKQHFFYFFIFIIYLHIWFATVVMPVFAEGFSFKDIFKTTNFNSEK